MSDNCISELGNTLHECVGVASICSTKILQPWVARNEPNSTNCGEFDILSWAATSWYPLQTGNIRLWNVFSFKTVKYPDPPFNCPTGAGQHSVDFWQARQDWAKLTNIKVSRLQPPQSRLPRCLQCLVAVLLQQRPKVLKWREHKLMVCKNHHRTRRYTWPSYLVEVQGRPRGEYTFIFLCFCQ